MKESHIYICCWSLFIITALFFRKALKTCSLNIQDGHCVLIMNVTDYQIGITVKYLTIITINSHFVVNNVFFFSSPQQDVNMNQSVIPTETYVKVVGSLRSFQVSLLIKMFLVQYVT